jgi:hypothetical protein
MRKTTAVVLVLTFYCGLQILSRIAVAHAVAAPLASKIQILKLTIDAPYEIASPHQGLWEQSKGLLFPTVHAAVCSTCPPGSKPKATCNPNCSLGGCNCPDCISGPCTIFTCAVTVTSGGCQSTSNPQQQCVACPNASSC